jgi:hypothetical protein
MSCPHCDDEEGCPHAAASLALAIIQTVALWTLRAILAIGCIAAGLMRNEEVASGCFVALVCSFWLLD